MSKKLHISLTERDLDATKNDYVVKVTDDSGKYVSEENNKHNTQVEIDKTTNEVVLTADMAYTGYVDVVVKASTSTTTPEPDPPDPPEEPTPKLGFNIAGMSDEVFGIDGSDQSLTITSEDDVTKVSGSIKSSKFKGFQYENDEGEMGFYVVLKIVPEPEGATWAYKGVHEDEWKYPVEGKEDVLVWNMMYGDVVIIQISYNGESAEYEVNLSEVTYTVEPDPPDPDNHISGKDIIAYKAFGIEELDREAEYKFTVESIELNNAPFGAYMSDGSGEYYEFNMYEFLTVFRIFFGAYDVNWDYVNQQMVITKNGIEVPYTITKDNEVIYTWKKKGTQEELKQEVGEEDNPDEPDEVPG